MRALIQRKVLYPAAGALFVLILASRLPSLNQPFGRDQGIFACIGQNILRGFVPYRDLWDQKPPAIHFTYALFLGLFGDSMRVMQVVDLLVLVLTAFMVYSVVKEISGTRAGTLAMLIYFFYSDPLFYHFKSGYWARSQAETFMVPFLVAGLWAFVRFMGSRSERLVWLAGLLWGGAFLYKYTAIFYPFCALVFAGLFLISAGDRPWRRRVRRLGRISILLVCGFGTALLPVVIWFGARGALDDLISITVLYNLKYAGAAQGGVGLILGQVAKWVMRNPFLWLTGLAGGVAVGFRGREDRRAVVWLFWLAAAWAAIAANRRYFNYYFIQIATPLAMLGAYILDLGIESAKKGTLRVLIVPALVASLLLIVPDIGKVRRNLEKDLDFALGNTSRDQYWARFVTGDFSFLEDTHLARYLKDKTAPDDRIFIFGFEPLVYFLADRRPASRFIYNDPITAAYVGPAVRARRLETMVADLEKSKPAYVVIVARDANLVDPTDSFRFFSGTPALRDFVEAGYTPDRRVGRFFICRRRPE